MKKIISTWLGAVPAVAIILLLYAGLWSMQIEASGGIDAFVRIFDGNLVPPLFGMITFLYDNPKTSLALVLIILLVSNKAESFLEEN